MESGGNVIERVVAVGVSKGVSPATAGFVSRLPIKVFLLSGKEVAEGRCRNLRSLRGVERK